MHRLLRARRTVGIGTAVFLALPAFAQSSPGTLDTTFVPPALTTNAVYVLALAGDGGIYVGGRLTGTNALGETLPGLAKVATNGVLDATFAPPAVADVVSALAVNLDGRVTYAGRRTGSLDAGVWRVNTDGSADASFTPDIPVSGTMSPWVYAVAVQDDGSVLGAGRFRSVGGEAQTNLFRLNADGTLDATFKTNFTTAGDIFALALQADGRILIGGDFTTVNTVARRGVARLNADGSLDTAFNPGTGLNGYARTLALQADGAVVVGGYFTLVNGTTRFSLARLLSTGALDTAFDTGAGAEADPGSLAVIEALALQADGRLLAAGEFSRFDGTTRTRLVRLQLDGSVDAAFDPAAGPDATARAVVVQPDGKAVIGGDFSAYDGTARAGAARLNNDGTTPLAPWILTSPSSRSVVVGQNTSFDVVALGTPLLAYQWRKDGLGLSGQTNASLVLDNARFADAGDFSVVVSNAGGAVTSSVARLTVTPSPLPPYIQAQPTNLLLAAGSAGTLGLSLAGTEPFAYQWRLNGTNVPAATNATLALGSVATNQAGAYSLRVTNSAGAITSQVASVVVYVPPSSVTVGAGSNATFRCLTYGTGPFTYAWQKDGLPLASARSATLGLTNVAFADAGDYAVTLTTPLGVVTPPAATLTVTMAPRITTEPQTQRVDVGGSATLLVVAEGSAPLSYQWLLNGTNLVGSTAANLLIEPAAADDAGRYSVIVSNALGAVTSRVATLTVAGASVGRLSLTDAAGFSGRPLSLPIQLAAIGDENALTFTVQFETNVFTFHSLSNGAALSPDASLILNSNSIAQGRLGILVAQPAGTTFPIGTNELLVLNLNAANGLSRRAVSPVTLVDTPVAREAMSPEGRPLALDWSNAVATVDFGLEADVASAPWGDLQLTASDWTLVGRMVAGLSATTNPSVFARADCAPTNTLGDGYLSAADWVQAGRYAAGLDVTNAAGGPTTRIALAAREGRRAMEPRLAATTARNLRAGSVLARAGGRVTVPLRFYSVGNENTLGFSLRFDPNALSLRSVKPGAALAFGSALLVNSNRIGEGRLGLLLALPTGKAFAKGDQVVLEAEFTAAAETSGRTLDLGFTDDPVTRETVSPDVALLPTQYTPGAVSVLAPIPPPVATSVARRPGDLLRMRWQVSEPGELVIVASTNLVDWSVITNFTLLRAGVLEFADPESRQVPLRFYRAGYPNDALPAP